jgi:deazaflavin-dependent oxidoreductase (nitroreductase family)
MASADAARPRRSDDFNERVIEEFRANRGRVGGALAGTTIILIHHIGNRSGLKRISPLAASVLGDGRLAVVASNGGSDTHPHWYHNLKADPRITVELGTEIFTALAEELDDAARAELWPDLIAESPSIREFQARTARRIPVLVLTRQGRPGAHDPAVAGHRR